MVVIQVLCFGFLVLAWLVVVYHGLLAVVGLVSPRPRQPTGTEPSSQHSFAIVIPAHNEAHRLAGTLQSCADLDYPSHKFRVFVLADNCSDETASVAGSLDAVCLERQDCQFTGKGHALTWVMDQIRPLGYDAILVLDADCTVDPHALRVFNDYLTQGEQVLQAKVAAANPDESPVSLAVAVGNLLENDLFYAPKDRLGWAVLLRGTGMVFRREVLERFPFAAFSEVEDKEYTVRLLRAGLTVRFLPEVCVHTEFPADPEQLQVQRQRWTVGSFHFGKALALRLIANGFTQLHPRLLDAGWTMLVGIRSLVFLQWLVTLALAVLCWSCAPGDLSNCLMGGSVLIGALHVLYWGLGICCLGVSVHRIGLLGTFPMLAMRMVVIFIAGILNPGTGTWAVSPLVPSDQAVE